MAKHAAMIFPTLKRYASSRLFHPVTFQHRYQVTGYTSPYLQEERNRSRSLRVVLSLTQWS